MKFDLSETNNKKQLNYRAAKTFILQKLRRELPKSLTYHCYGHTLDVFRTTRDLCAAEKISKYETKLAKTAALFHDCGFMNVYKEHEEEGCRIARENLPRFGYLEEEIEIICGMIMATKIPQSPKNKLEEIICDADLDYLGREDFYRIGHTLFEELKIKGILKDEESWNKIQVGFLKSHQYFTDTNLNRRAPQKQSFLKKLESLVATY